MELWNKFNSWIIAKRSIRAVYKAFPSVSYYYLLTNQRAEIGACLFGFSLWKASWSFPLRMKISYFFSLAVIQITIVSEITYLFNNIIIIFFFKIFIEKTITTHSIAIISNFRSYQSISDEFLLSFEWPSQSLLCCIQYKRVNIFDNFFETKRKLNSSPDKVCLEIRVIEVISNKGKQMYR